MCTHAVAVLSILLYCTLANFYKCSLQTINLLDTDQIVGHYVAMHNAVLCSVRVDWQEVQSVILMLLIVDV